MFVALLSVTGSAFLSIEDEDVSMFDPDTVPRFETSDTPALTPNSTASAATQRSSNVGQRDTLHFAASFAEPVTPSVGSQQNTSGRKLFGCVAAAAVIMVAGWFFLRDGGLEQQHPNWQYVVAAFDASNTAEERLSHVARDNRSSMVSAIVVTRSDANRIASSQIRSALRRNDLVTATAALQAVQQLPTVSMNADVRPPVLSAGSTLMQSLKNRRSELYEIELFDCCHEDGDVIEVAVNGESFAVVPILHAGSKLTVPLKRGLNTVSVRAVKDGAGGVTVSFRTSRGDYYARCLNVGEEHQLSVMVQ